MIRLRASDFWSKWGFGDGSLLHHLDDITTPEECDGTTLEFDVQNYLIRRYLVPLAPPGFEPEVWEGSGHNPWRSPTYGREEPPLWAETISGYVTAEQLLEAVNLWRCLRWVGR